MLEHPQQFTHLWKIHKNFFLILTLIAVVSVTLRITNLLSWPIFADEAIYIRWAQVMRAEPTLRFLPLTDGKQPLFMWLTIPFLKFVADPLLAGRLVSLASGLGTLIGLTLLTFRLSNSRNTAIIAAALYTITPYTFFFDRFALADSLLSMYFVWSIYFASLNVINPQLGYSLLVGVLIGAAWLTKSPAIYLFMLIPFVSLIALSQARQTPWLIVRWFLSFIISSLTAFAVYNLLRLGPEFHQIALRNRDYIYPFNEIISQPFKALIPNFISVLGFYWQLLTPGVFLLALFSLWKFRAISLGLLIFLFAWIVIPATSQSLIARSVTARYFLYTVPPFLILASMAIQFFISHINALPRRSRYLPAIGLLCVLVAPCIYSYLIIFRPHIVPLPRIERSGYLEEWTAGYGLRDIAAYIKQLPSDQPILIATEGYFGTTPDGLQIYFDKSPNVKVIGQSYEINQISDGLYQALDQNRVFLVFNDERLHISDPSTVGLQLITSYPKAIRPDGTHQSLQFFELKPTPITVSDE